MYVINASKKKLTSVISFSELLTFTSDTKILEESGYEGVTEIRACFNFISSISISTHTFPNLSILSLVCNNIKEIPNLDCCPNLSELNLNKNAIARLDNLNSVPNLKCLSLSSNLIASLENISKLNCLERLILSSNKIEAINYSTLPTLFHNLTQLGLLDNNLKSLDEIEQLLDSAPNLTKLSLGLNPLTNNNLLSTSYLLTDLRIQRRDIFNPSSMKEMVVSENSYVLHVRLFVMSKCTKLKYLDLSPISQ